MHALVKRFFRLSPALAKSSLTNSSGAAQPSPRLKNPRCHPTRSATGKSKASKQSPARRHLRQSFILLSSPT